MIGAIDNPLSLANLPGSGGVVTLPGAVRVPGVSSMAPDKPNFRPFLGENRGPLERRTPSNRIWASGRKRAAAVSSFLQSKANFHATQNKANLFHEIDLERYRPAGRCRKQSQSKPIGAGWRPADGGQTTEDGRRQVRTVSSAAPNKANSRPFWPGNGDRAEEQSQSQACRGWQAGALQQSQIWYAMGRMRPAGSRLGEVGSRFRRKCNREENADCGVGYEDQDDQGTRTAGFAG
jgi:hypothetical protein